MSRLGGEARRARSGPERAPARLIVRRAQAGDLEPLGFFFDTMLRRDYFMRRGQLKEIVAGRRHEVFVAEIDEVLVGVAIATRGARLVNALVHPAYRGLGIGRRLVRDSGVTEIRAKTDMVTGNPEGFYERLGFRSAGPVNRKGNITLMRKADATRVQDAPGSDRAKPGGSDHGGR